MLSFNLLYFDNMLLLLYNMFVLIISCLLFESIYAF